MSVLVTDGNQRAALAVTRALGRAGIPVTVGEAAPASLAGSSRFCAGVISYPSPVQEPEEFQAFLHNETSAGKYRLVLPITDITMQLVSSAQPCLSPRVCLPFPDEQRLLLARDKRYVHLLARRVGIPIPTTLMMSEEESLEDVARRIRYPAVIKPRFSRFLRNGSWTSGSVQYAENPDDLKAKYASAHTRIPFPLVQEKVEGEGRGVFLCLWQGQLKAAFCHRRLREKPPWGGVSVYCESVALDHNLVQKSSELLQAIGWNGVAMVEFKLDRQDGQAKLMEINGRFWGSLQLAIDAGVNFPLLLYRLASGEDVAAQFSYRVGVKSRWLLGDLDSLVIALRAQGKAAQLARGSRSRLQLVQDFLRFFERDLHYDVWDSEDLRPAWFEWKAYRRDVWRSFVQRLRRS